MDTRHNAVWCLKLFSWPVLFYFYSYFSRSCCSILFCLLVLLVMFFQIMAQHFIVTIELEVCPIVLRFLAMLLLSLFCREASCLLPWGFALVLHSLIRWLFSTSFHKNHIFYVPFCKYELQLSTLHLMQVSVTIQILFKTISIFNCDNRNFF